MIQTGNPWKENPTDEDVLEMYPPPKGWKRPEAAADWLPHAREVYAQAREQFDMWHAQFSFDDLAIGFPNGSVIGTRLLERPAGLTNDAWYKFAAQTCRLLGRMRIKGAS